VTGPPFVVTLSPSEAGALLGQSENWMLEKARAGKIPCTRPGRKIRFTPQHVAEIARMFEKRPKAPVLASRAPARSRSSSSTDAPALEARPPRRKRVA
jgi:excisionase family DNA binding protein